MVLVLYMYKAQLLGPFHMVRVTPFHLTPPPLLKGLMLIMRNWKENEVLTSGVF